MIDRKLAGPEKSELLEVDLGFHESQCQGLVAELEAASENSHLPDQQRIESWSKFASEAYWTVEWEK